MSIFKGKHYNTLLNIGRTAETKTLNRFSELINKVYSKNPNSKVWESSLELMRVKIDGLVSYRNFIDVVKEFCNGKLPQKKVKELGDYIKKEPFYNGICHSHITMVNSNTYRLTVSTESAYTELNHYLYFYFRFNKDRISVSNKIYFVINEHRIDFTYDELEKSLNYDMDLLEMLDEFNQDSKIIKKKNYYNYFIYTGKMFDELVRARRIADREFIGVNQIDKCSNLICNEFKNLNNLFPFYLLDSILLFGKIKCYNGKYIGTIVLNRKAEKKCLFVVEFPKNFNMGSVRNELIAECSYKLNRLATDVVNNHPYMYRYDDWVREFKLICGSREFNECEVELLTKYMKSVQTYENELDDIDYKNERDITYFDGGIR